jgi:GT2 family glycosyltransferase
MIAGRTLGVVVPTHDTIDLTVGCLAALANCTTPADQIVVVDDGSSDGTADTIRRDFPGVSVVRNQISEGFSAAANRGLANLDTDLLVLLNSDTLASPEALTAWRRAFDGDPDLGIAGARLAFPDGRPQWSGGQLPSPLWLLVVASGFASALDRHKWWRRLRPVSGSSSDTAAVEWVTGAALALRRQVWLDVGPLDDGYRFYGQDLELCWRAGRAGWRVAVVDDCHVIHHHGASVATIDGAVAQAHPAQLWLDLVRFETRRGGTFAGERARASLRTGAHLRLLGRSVRVAGLYGQRRRTFLRETAAYVEALRALDRPASV